MSGGVSSRPAAENGTRWARDREEILARYIELLTDVDSPLLRSGERVLDQLRSQVEAFTDALLASLSRSAPAQLTRDAELDLIETIGRTRAGIHPSQSLHAATLVYEAALPTIAARLAESGDPTPERSAGILLNRQIVWRTAASARVYVDYLLARKQSTTRAEHQRLSRTMHDVAGPAVAVGLQHLELLEHYLYADPARVAEKLQATRQSLTDALNTIRGLAVQYRENVASRGFADAVRHYVDTVPTDIDTEVRFEGDLGHLSLAHAEELFLILREAIRNAVEHADPHTIRTVVRATASEVEADVTDDGIGFDVESMRPSRVGLESMRERAELLGGYLAVTSAPGAGTSVAVRIPLLNVLPDALG